jgi:hypothetical protein
MAVRFTDQAPRTLHYTQAYNDTNSDWEKLDPELDMKISEQTVEELAEIFKTPLTGTYNWDYQVQDDRIKKLYNLGKQLNWNADIDIDWKQEVRQLSEDEIAFVHPFHDYEEYQALSAQDQENFTKHMHTWTISQFLHGEQGALLVASQLISCAPTFNAKLYASSQAFDEARHVEVFNKYLDERAGLRYPVNNALKSLLDKILTDERWDLKFIGMQIVIEGLALSAFQAIKTITPDPSLSDLLGLVIRDESRHVTFGVNYLEEFIKTLTEEEKNERAMFAYEACLISRERLVPTDVFEYWGWNQDIARELFLKGNVFADFRKLLFTRVVPNLKRVGLLTPEARLKFEEMDILQYEDMANDGDIDWADLSRPLDINGNHETDSDKRSEVA